MAIGWLGVYSGPSCPTFDLSTGVPICDFINSCNHIARKAGGSWPQGQLESDSRMPLSLCIICIFASCCRMASAAQLEFVCQISLGASHLPLERSSTFPPLSGWKFLNARGGLWLVQHASQSFLVSRGRVRWRRRSSPSVEGQNNAHYRQ